jgi:hypothetical protein
MGRQRGHNPDFWKIITLGMIRIVGYIICCLPLMALYGQSRNTVYVD